MTSSSTQSNILQSKWFRIGLTFTVALFAVMYIWQVNIAATAGFTIRDLESDIEELEMDQKRLESEVARLQSVESVTSRVQMLGLTRVQDVDYIQASQGFAVR